MSDFSYAVDADGVATITWDCPGRTMNVMKFEGLSEMENLANTAFADDNVRGIVITSGKDSFSGGMQLSGFEQLRNVAVEESPAGLLEWMMAMHRLLRHLETGGKTASEFEGRKPVVAALPGTAVGIGLELPLACHRIICADNPLAKIGLPEIKVGLFPGAGGTTRLVRMLGLAAAGPWLFRGTLADPARAREAGFVHEVVPPDQLQARAREWVLNASDDDLVKPWDRKKFRLPGGSPYDPAGFQSFVGAPVMVNSRTFGVYPAATACLSAIYEGALVPFDTALRIEARWFSGLLMEPSTSSMIRTVFTDRKALAKGVRRPPGIERKRISRVGVVGAGMMGAGISLVAAKAGMDVVMVDRAAGIVLTNNHVVEGADEVTIELSDGREFKAVDIKTDPDSDLAVVRLANAEDLPTAALGNSDELVIGDWVLAIGNPFELETTGECRYHFGQRP